MCSESVCVCVCVCRNVSRGSMYWRQCVGGLTLDTHETHAFTCTHLLMYYMHALFSIDIQWKLVSSIVPLLEFLVSSSSARGPWTSVYLLVQNSLSSSNGAARTSGYIELETPPLDRNNSNLLELILIIRRFSSKVQIYLDLL